MERMYLHTDGTGEVDGYTVIGEPKESDELLDQIVKEELSKPGARLTEGQLRTLGIEVQE